MPQDLAAHVDAMAEKYGVPPAYAQAIFQIESAGGKNIGRSKAGAIGPFQLMPNTAKMLNININDPLQNIEGGVKYYSQLLQRFGDPILAAVAYNAGPTKVARAGGIPNIAETKDYAQKFTNLVGANNLMDKVAPPVARSKPGQPLTLKLAEPTPYKANPTDIQADTESNFASLLAKIGVGGKRKGKGKSMPGILSGLF